MNNVKDYSFSQLYKKMFGKNVHFTSDCEFFPNFDVVIKVNDIYINKNEIIFKGKTKNNKMLTIGSNMHNLQFEII
jgi:hypothetical protein